LLRKNQRSFSSEFKRRVVEELHRKKQYSRGKFDNEPTEEGVLKDRVEKLERLVGKLTPENEFLKRGLQRSLNHSPRNGRSLPRAGTLSAVSEGRLA
jgi:transposase